MTNTIKITNSQGQEEEWVEISPQQYQALDLKNTAYFYDNDSYHFYKILPSKEVYPKVSEIEFLKDVRRNLEVINLNIYPDGDEEEFEMASDYCSNLIIEVNKRLQALAEAERIQNNNQGKSVISPQKSSDNIQNKTEEQKDGICECGHLASLHSDGEYSGCGECFDDEAVTGNCKCKEFKEKQGEKEK